jgi:subtilisin-like proprotein convertase family protein
MLFVGLLPLSTANGVTGASTHKLLVDRADAVTLADLQTRGAHLLVDYDSFSLWEVSDADLPTFAARDSVAQHDDFDDLYLRSGTITPTKGVPPVPANLRQSKASGKQFWMIQFIGPIKQDWVNNLAKLGAEIVIYMPNNAYVIWVDGGQLAQVEALVGKDPTVQWTGAYEPAYRLEPSLQQLSGTQLTPVTIQFYRTANTVASIASVQTLGGALLRQPEDVLGFTNISLPVPVSQLAAIANRADVFNVEPYVTPIKNDEVQGQILAGNITTPPGNIVPTGLGYLAWLTSQGFPTDPTQYPIVDVVDDGIDNGTTNPLHPDFHQLGVGANPSRLVANGNCTADASGDGKAGHGNLNAGIVGSFNNLTGAPHQDPTGYRRDLGISPYTRLAGTKIFNNAGTFDLSQCSSTNAGIVANAYAAGAAFTSNSWGSNVNGAYNASSQVYDSLTRDASSGTAGNQEMLHIFSAGNKGPNATTLGSPGTAKNVLTVGATENVRDDGTLDGCSYAGANNADDMATFSSRGPAADGRIKPDIVAPGTHVQGPASQDPGYDGTGVCGGDPNPPNIYYPASQTLYTWSSGTSHSAPAVAGATSLLYNYYGRVLNPGHVASPAMLKALLLNRPRYLNGAGTGGNLPSSNQGWGDPNLGDLFDTATSRVLLDQTNVFTATGNTYVTAGSVASAGKPLRVTLVWTDAPGPTTGNAFVNNLDLQVTIGGNTYKGNVFSGAWSAPGGTADVRDNVENVFIPAGVGSQFTVKVTAANIAGVGVPGVAGNNQDFALVISNGAIGAGGANLGAQPVTVNDAAPGGNNNGLIEQGETVTLTIPFKNEGSATATGVSATLTTADSTVTVITGASAYPNIAAGGTQSNTTPFKITLAASHPCAVPVNLSLALTYNGGPQGTLVLTLPTSFPLGSSTNFASTDVPKAIPDNNPTGVASNLPIATTGTVGKVVVRLTNVTHTFDGDLVLTLIAPDNTPVTLVANRGGSGDNFTNTVLDDAAATAISAGSAPFTGTFRPEQLLSTMSGRAMNGTWQLKAVDNAAMDTGTINSWSLDITPALCTTAAALQITSISPKLGPTAGGTTVLITGTGFTGAAVTVDGAPVMPASITATQITLTMPPHTVGTVPIAVTTLSSVTVPYTYGDVSSLPPPAPPGGSPGSPGVAPNPRPSGAPSGTTPGSLPNPRP